MVRERLRATIRLLPLVVGVTFTLVSAPAAADLYRWVDAKGVVNYSNIPPQGVKAKQIPDTQPTVSIIPPPKNQPELRQAAREADLLRRIERLEDELVALRRASAPSVIYTYPIPSPAVAYTAPILYPYPIYPGAIYLPGVGHRFKALRPGFRAPTLHVPRGVGSGHAVRTRF